jgi:hypothetical protein
MSEVKPLNPKHKPSIGREKAVQEAANWRMIMHPFMGDKVLRGFYIPMEDILDLAEMHKEATWVRGYFIIENPDKFTNVRLALVPVSPDGKDILTKKGLEGEEESTIYDFTQPCPHLCDEKSPMFNG